MAFKSNLINLKHLNSMIVPISDIDISFVVNSNTQRAINSTYYFSSVAYFVDKCTIGSEDGHFMMTGHHNETVPGCSNPTRRVQHASLLAVCTKCPQQLSFLCEHKYCTVCLVNDVEKIIWANGELMEFSFSCSLQILQAFLQFSGIIENEYLVAVKYKEVIVVVESQASRIAKNRFPNQLHEFARRIKQLDAIAVRVAHSQNTPAVEGNPSHPLLELANLLSLSSSDGFQEFPLIIEHADLVHVFVSGR